MNLTDIEDTIHWVDLVVGRLGVDDVKKLSPAICAKPKKECIGKWLCDTLSTLKKVTIEFQKLRTATDPLQLDLIKSQKQVIELQGELLACKNDQLQCLQTSVKNTVEKSMKAEFITYSAKLQSPAPAIATDTVKSVVKTVVEEEDRSRSLMIFGLAESGKENLNDKVTAVLQDIGEKPRFEACRLGAPGSSDDTEKVRPVKVTVSSSLIASQILSKSRKLKNSVDHTNVFICPDRSPEQQVKQRELVKELRARQAAEPRKKHFIKNGTVHSIEGLLT